MELCQRRRSQWFILETQHLGSTVHQVLLIIASSLMWLPSVLTVFCCCWRWVFMQSVTAAIDLYWNASLSQFRAAAQKLQGGVDVACAAGAEAR
jgi:hypothetical protein